MNIHNKTVGLIGGAGYIGSQIVKRLYKNNQIVVYSRDELKHYELNREFPKVNCVMGDVNNFERLKRTVQNCDILINCAAIKQIHAATKNPEEATQTIVNGAINSKLASIENDMEASCLITTDKCTEPNLIYGHLKAAAQEIYVNNNERGGTRFSACKYGNILNSKMSIIPTINYAINNQIVLKINNEEMTRFNYLAEDAIDLIFTSLDYSNSVIIPKLRSFRVLDLFKIYNERFGLIFTDGKLKIGEKLHEKLFGEEESRRLSYDRDKNIFIVGLNETTPNEYTGTDYSSRDYCMSKEELDDLLKTFNYFR